VPRFTGQNKKRIDPRYFLHETTNRDLEEGEAVEPGERGYIEKAFDREYRHIAKFDAALEKYEVKFDVDYPDSIKRILSVLEAIDSGYAATLRRLYPDDLA